MGEFFKFSITKILKKSAQNSIYKCNSDYHYQSKLGNHAVFLTDKSKRSHMSGYTKRSQGHRYQMEVFRKAGHNQTMIPTILSTHKSTVSREL